MPPPVFPQTFALGADRISDKLYLTMLKTSPLSTPRRITQRATVLASLAAALLMPPICLSGSQAEGGEDWIELLNGKNLDGWDIKIRGHELNDNFGNTFRVEDGILKIRYDQYETFANRFGHIFYKKPYSHYHLVVEYRFVGEQVSGGPGWAFRNNGIMFHSQSAASMKLDQDFPNSIEFQLLGGDGERNRPNGSICTPGTHVVINGELRREHCIDSGGPTHHGDQWVTAELIVRGDKSIRHILNGKEVMKYSGTQLDDGTPLKKGYLALQSESHPTDIRSVRIRELDPEN